MKCLPNVLFVLGDSSWLRWIIPFLQSSSYNTKICAISDEGKKEEGITFFPADSPQEVAYLIANEKPTAVVLLSHQNTLIRDNVISNLLKRNYDLDVLAQSSKAVRVGTDKVCMKEFFEADKIAAPQYTIANSYLKAYRASQKLGYPVVFEQPDKHEGGGIKIITCKSDIKNFFKNQKLDEQLIIEKFIQGIEFSIIVYGDKGKYRALPPVYKGETSLAGIHPCKRFRMAPAPKKYKNIGKAKEMAIEVAKKLKIRGILELEIIDTLEELYAIEANVRLAATMRMACLASGINIFSFLGEIALGKWTLSSHFSSPSNIAIEFPVPSDMSTCVIEKLRKQPGIFVSSRITINGRNVKDILSKIDVIEEFMDCSSIIAQLHQQLEG